MTIIREEDRSWKKFIYTLGRKEEEIEKITKIKITKIRGIIKIR